MLFVSRREAHVKLIDSAVGAGPHCACLTESKQLVVGGDAVFFYEQEERSTCYGLSEAKRQMLWLNGYLIVIGPDEVPVDAPPRDVITIYDLKNKLVAYVAKLDPVVHAVIEWNALHVLTAKGQLLRFSELDMSGKMDMLFKKSLFLVAIALAKSQSSDPGYVLRIYHQYGDHLYAKGDYDGAVTQYIETIPRIEPSNIIKKFLEPQRIRDLTRYLSALHDAGRASAGHVLLLLSCYAQLKATRELTRFAASPAPAGIDRDSTARVLLSSGHTLHALRFAQVHGMDTLYLSILAGAIDAAAATGTSSCAVTVIPPVASDGHSDGHSGAVVPAAATTAAASAGAGGNADVVAALQHLGGPLAVMVRFISSLSAAAAAQALLTHGALLARPPAGSAATAAFDGLLELCLRLCTRWEPLPPPPLPRLPEEEDREYAAATARFHSQAQDAATAAAAAAAVAATPAAGEGGARDPLLLAPLFVAQPLVLERFYESLLAFDVGQCNGTLLAPAVLSALLEVYLSINKDAASGASAGAVSSSSVVPVGGAGAGAGDDDGGVVGARESQIMTLLRTQSHRLDLAQALVLCEAMEFEKGLLYLYTKMERYQDVIHHYVRLLHSISNNSYLICVYNIYFNGNSLISNYLFRPTSELINLISLSQFQ